MLCRLAVCPTRTSPASVNATIDGVVRAPSEFSMTFAVLPSITATHELVVPRSIPIALAMWRSYIVRWFHAPMGDRFRRSCRIGIASSVLRLGNVLLQGGLAEHVPVGRWSLGGFLDLDLLGCGAGGLRDCDFQHALRHCCLDRRGVHD